MKQTNIHLLSAGKGLADNISKTLSAMQVEKPEVEYFTSIDISSDMVSRLLQREVSQEEFIVINKNIANSISQMARKNKTKKDHQKIFRSVEKMDTINSNAPYNSRYRSYGFRLGIFAAPKNVELSAVSELPFVESNLVGDLTPIEKARSILEMINKKNDSVSNNVLDTEHSRSDPYMTHNAIHMAIKPECKSLGDIKHSLKFLDSDQLLDVLSEVHYQLRHKLDLRGGV